MSGQLCSSLRRSKLKDEFKYKMISFEVNECNVIPFQKVIQTAAPGQVLTNCHQRATSPFYISRSLNHFFFKGGKNGLIKFRSIRRQSLVSQF
jgi:hypothetical protein